MSRQMPNLVDQVGTAQVEPKQKGRVAFGPPALLAFGGLGKSVFIRLGLALATSGAATSRSAGSADAFFRETKRPASAAALAWPWRYSTGYRAAHISFLRLAPHAHLLCAPRPYTPRRDSGKAALDCASSGQRCRTCAPHPPVFAGCAPVPQRGMTCSRDYSVRVRQPAGYARGLGSRSCREVTKVRS